MNFKDSLSNSVFSLGRAVGIPRFVGLALAIAAGVLATAHAEQGAGRPNEADEGFVLAYRSALPDAAAEKAPAISKSKPVSTGRDKLLDAIEREASIRTTLEKEFLDQLKAILPRNGEGIVFGHLELPGRLEVPPAAWDVRFEFRLPQRGIGRVLGRGTMTLKGKTIKRFNGSVVIDRQARGLQVNRIIRRGEAIGPYDLELFDTTLSQLPPDALTEQVIAAGSRARTELRPGVWLTGRMFELPKLVKRRQLVTLKLVNGQIEITSKGVALEDGGAGDVIRIKNVGSGREVFGRVIASGLVEVIF